MAFQSSSRLCLIDGSKSFSMVGPIGSTPLSQFFDIKRANTGNFVRNAGPMDTSIIFLTSRTRSFFGPEEEEARRQNPRWVHDLPPKPSLWDRVCFPLLSFLAWMRLLCDNFDRRFVAMVFCGVHLLKGFCGGLMVVEGLIYMRLHTGATSKTIFQAISQSAWGLKPLYALVSDTCAFRGYRRAPWVVLTAVVAAMAYTTLVLGNWSLSGPLVCLCFFCAKVQLSWTDLMIEATYTEKMRVNAPFSADMVSFVWSGVGLFGLVGIFVAGPGIDWFGPIALLAGAIPFSALIIYPAVRGWLTETRIPPEQRGRSTLDGLRQQWHYFTITVLLTVCVVTTMLSGIMQVDAASQAFISVTLSAITGTAAMALLPASIWKPMLFMFLSNAMGFSTAGFVDNFYLDSATPEESARTGYPVCEDCPHFSATFYYTVIGVLDQIMMVVGSWVFRTYMRDWTYRTALSVSGLLMFGTSMLDIVQFNRWNEPMGIPDWVFMMGKSSVQNTVGMISFMPTTILISKVCPPGIEATVFAMLAGFANFGAILAGYIGAYVLTLLGLDQVGKGTHDDFSQAWKACLLSGCASLVPLLVLLPFMIPSASMEADLVHEEGLLPHPLDPLETSIYGEYRDYGALGDSRRGSAVALRPESGPAGAEGQGTRGPAEGAC